MESKIMLAAAGKRLFEESTGHRRLEAKRSDAERSLRDVHERFKSAFGDAPIGMALIELDGNWLQVNDSLCLMTGYSQSELRATTLRALTHPDDADIDQPLQQQLIDGEFIRDLAAKAVNQLIVNAIVGIARGMGKKTIAEFVGDANTTQLLRVSGVDCAQGYHVGPPRPVTEVLSVASYNSASIPLQKSLSHRNNSLTEIYGNRILHMSGNGDKSRPVQEQENVNPRRLPIQ